MRIPRWAFAAALLVAGASAQAGECFSMTDWRGWTPAGDDVLYLKVRMHDVYRVELSQKESFLKAPGMHLVSKSWGSDMVCNPIDLDLKLADNFFPGMATHLFIKSITKLTSEEATALPKEYQP